jgi:CBS domain containing-hemolysin-like protein
MWLWFWIIGVLAVDLAALSNVFLARGVIGPGPKGGLARRLKGGLAGESIYLELRAALIFVVALASSLASLSLISSSLFLSSPAAHGVGHPLAWTALGAVVWFILILAFAVVVPVWFAPALGREGPVSALTGIAVRFFVLPIGKVAARIARNAAGSATYYLEEASARELHAVFSRDPSEALRGEPLASVVKEFARTTAEDIMVPRSAMVAVASSSTLAECVDVFATKRFSRLPVYEGDVESVIGIVHVMDLLKENDLTKTVSQIVRPVPMVPESKRCDELLKEFQKSHGYMAIVLDEYGGTAGLVTVEDVLEELVGEMGHEPVAFRRTVRRGADGLFLVHAQIEIEKFESATGIKLPKGDYETLAGYLLQEFGRIPEVGASVRRSRVLYEVAEADSRRIKLVKVSVEAGEEH